MTPAPRWTPDRTGLPDFRRRDGTGECEAGAGDRAAGGHNVLLVGSPGAGKSMLARRLPSILPDMTRAEALQTTEIYSVAGMFDPRHPLVDTHSLQPPHHTASTVSLSGGGGYPGRGDILPTTACCFWTSCRSSARRRWRHCASRWRTAL